MAEDDKVNKVITDAVTQSSVATVASTPGLSVAQSYLSASQANAVLFANLVAEQHRHAVSSHAATNSDNIGKILDGMTKILEEIMRKVSLG